MSDLTNEIEESEKMFECLYNSAWSDDTEYLAKRVLEFIPHLRKSYRFFSTGFKNLKKILNEMLDIVPGYYKISYYVKYKFSKSEIIKIESGEEYKLYDLIRIFGYDIKINKCQEDGTPERLVFPIVDD